MIINKSNKNQKKKRTPKKYNIVLIEKKKILIKLLC